MEPNSFHPPEKDPAEKTPAAWLVAPTVALLLGQALAPLDLSDHLSTLYAVLLSICCIAVSLFLGWRRRRASAFLFLFSAAALGLGYFTHYSLLNPRFPNDHLRLMTNGTEPLYVEGILYREPERLSDRSRWYLRAERVWQPSGAQETRGKALITVRRPTAEWHYGDRIRLWLKVRPPRNSGNPGGFDYQAYLARRGIYLTGFLEHDVGVELLRRENGGVWVRVENLRRRMSRFLESRLPPEEAGLMKALVIGDRGGISSHVRSSFVSAGVAHLLAISGLHVGMLALVLFLLVRYLVSWSETFLLRFSLIKVAAVFSVLGVMLYTVLAGSMIPTVRAAIMVGAYGLAVLMDREDEVLNSLCLAALLIGLWWPGVVMEISFQLSFLAVLFIVWGMGQLHEWWPARKDDLPQERSRLRRGLRQSVFYLSVSLLATLGTGPMIAYHFGYLSLAGLLANPVIVPLVGFLIVPLGLIIGFFSLLSPVAALPFLWVVQPLSSLLLWMVSFFSGLPSARIEVPVPDLWEIGALYLVFISLLLARRRSQLFVGVAGISVLVLGAGAYRWQERWSRQELRVTHLSVGHGDAAVVQFPGSKVLLIDAGGTSFGEFDPGEFIVEPFLRSRKIRKVDYLLVSHPRVDHYGGMKAIMEQFAPSEFWSGPGKAGTARYRELEEYARSSGIKRLIFTSDDPCRSIGGVQVCFLYPEDGKDTDTSLVVRLAFGKVRWLFAADIESKDERSLLQRSLDISSAVLKVPRHGSSSSNSEQFVSAVKPRLAIFSVGHRNPFGLPKEEVLSRYIAAGAAVLRTDQDGAISIRTDGRNLWYGTYASRKRGRLEAGNEPEERRDLPR